MGIPDESIAVERTASAFWCRKVRRVQLRVNLGWVLNAMLPLLFTGCVVMMALTLAGRRAGWPPAALAWAGAGIAIAILLTSFLRCSSHFISFESARAKLEDVLGLHNRLSAAAAGIGDWPPRESWKNGHWPWNWRRLGVLPVAGVALLIAALLIPIPVQRAAGLPPMATPPSLETVQEWLAELEKNEALEPESLEPIKEQAEELARQDPGEWYSHASLEAADHLRRKLENGLQNMAQNAGKLDSSLNDAAGEMSEAEAAQWKEQTENALSALEGNLPGLSRELAGKLRQIDPSKLRSLTAAQIAELREKLAEAKGACEKCLGGLPIAERGEGPGRGGIDRGPGTAPLSLEEDETNLNTDKIEALNGSNLGDVALGDRVGMSDAVHDVDKSADHRAANGGAVGSAGSGADAVWLQQNTTPEERRRLRNFFQ